MNVPEARRKYWKGVWLPGLNGFFVFIPTYCGKNNGLNVQVTNPCVHSGSAAYGGLSLLLADMFEFGI